MKYCIAFIIFFIPLLFANVVQAQDEKPSPVQFHGSNTLVGQYSNMQGIGSEIPPSFFRNDLQMTLSVYDIPISATFFITSMERDYRQSIKNFRIHFDARELLKSKGLGDAENIISSVAFYKLNNLETVKEGLMKANDLLKVELLNCQRETDKLQQEYQVSKKELEDAKLKKDNDAVEQAKAKVEEAKSKLDKKQSNCDNLKTKLDEAKARIEGTMAKIEQAK
ncbi:MAG: hypothetical protein HQ541_21570, partial [Mariniphaga sp.]|nr:hypothetical protein [Mariniphaga sp.]